VANPTDLSLSPSDKLFALKVDDEGLKKTLVIASEERLGKHLTHPSGEERKTFKFRRFS
jgi:hypothetical protein